MRRWNRKYTYLGLNLGSLFFPLLYSFHPRIAFVKRWKAAGKAILLTAIPFIAWDAVFTRKGYWSFNPKYLTGRRLFGLPAEEVGFFGAIPFACLFIYDILRKRPHLHLPEKPSRIVFLLASLGLILLAFRNKHRPYTFVVSLLTAPALLVFALVPRLRYRGLFLSGYLFHLIPFFLVNGMLTALPVVRYNDKANLGRRIGTIPVEDPIYSLLLLLGNVALYEKFLENKA